MSLNLVINNVYTFQTLAPAILNATYRNAKLEASYNFQTATKQQNVEALYRAIYPVLPPGTPSDPATQIYHRFITESGERVILADNWINGGTVITVTSLSFGARIVNATIEDRERVRKALSHLGVNFTITDG